MTIDSTRRLQSLYVPVSDGVRLAVDVWLPVERIAAGERVSTAFRATRYHRAEQPPSPGPEADSNLAAGELWASTDGADPYEVLSAVQREVLDQAAALAVQREDAFDSAPEGLR